MNGFYAIEFRNGWKLFNVRDAVRFKNCRLRYLNTKDINEAKYAVFKLNN